MSLIKKMRTLRYASWKALLAWLYLIVPKIQLLSIFTKFAGAILSFTPLQSQGRR
jgi:hypothetical protein